MDLNLSAVSYMLDYMTIHHRDMLLSDSRYTLTENYDFIDFCFSFLYRLGYLVVWDDVSMTYKIIN